MQQGIHSRRIAHGLPHRRCRRIDLMLSLRLALQVEKEQEALSQLTMLAQQLWENERQYKPAAPAPLAAPVAAAV